MPYLCYKSGRAKFRIDTRKWMPSRMNQKKYGDKIQDDNTDNAVSLMAKFMKELIERFFWIKNE